MKKTQKNTKNEKTRPSSDNGIFIAGIGASAGGLGAFRDFFKAMPSDSGLTFVLVQHLDPHHESLMVDLLSKHTDMPVEQAQDGMKVQRDHVYMIPPQSLPFHRK